MNPSGWDSRLDDLVFDGFEKSAAAREALLNGAEAGQASAVRALWEAHDQAGEFLRKPAISPSPRTCFRPGQMIAGRYRVIRMVGSGGMGEVYKAEDEHLPRTVALKTPSIASHGGTELLARFKAEARAISSLAHPNICGLYDLVWDSDSPVLVMEFLEGDTLAARLRNGALPIAQFLEIAIGVAIGLEYAHQRGVVHRDLKPSNIMLTSAGPKILDFGIAEHVLPFATADTLRRAVENVIAGSVGYMSPEQARGELVDFRSDIFSFGVVLAEMAGGRQAANDASTMSLLSPESHLQAPLVADAPESISGELRRTIDRCVQNAPEDRFQTIEHLRNTLLNLRRESENRAPRWALHRFKFETGPSVPARTYHWPLVLLLPVTVLLCWFAWAPRKSPQTVAWAPPQPPPAAYKMAPKPPERTRDPATITHGPTSKRRPPGLPDMSQLVAPTLSAELPTSLTAPTEVTEPGRFRLLAHYSGTSATVKGDRVVIQEQRSRFILSRDQSLIVYFEWQAPPGRHVAVGTLKPPSAGPGLSTQMERDSQNGLLKCLWVYHLDPNMMPGLWRLDVQIDGVPAGFHVFEIVADHPQVIK